MRENHVYDAVASCSQRMICQRAGALIEPVMVPAIQQDRQWRQGDLRDAAVLSDDAGKFDIGQHALCWVLRNGWCRF